MSTRRRTTPWLALVLGATVLVACGKDDAPEPGAWPEMTETIAIDGPVWRVSGSVQLPDGSTIDLDEGAGGYVVTSAGVWYLTAAVDGGPVQLHLATADGTNSVIEGVHPRARSIATSPDGHWLGFIDDPGGEAGLGEAVVVDTLDGREVVRSSQGLGDDLPEDTDWTDLYEELPVELIGVTEDTAYVRGLHDTIAYDLGTGDATVLEEIGATRPAWLDEVSPEPPYSNPTGTWSIPEPPFGENPTFLAEDGTEVATRFAGPDSPLVDAPLLEEWTLAGWVDDETAIGVTPTGGSVGEPSWEAPAVIECVVPSGECALVPGTEDGVDLPLDRPGLVHPQSYG